MNKFDILALVKKMWPSAHNLDSVEVIKEQENSKKRPNKHHKHHWEVDYWKSKVVPDTFYEGVGISGLEALFEDTEVCKCGAQRVVRRWSAC